MNNRLFLLAYIISTFTLTVQAIEGYKDIYLDREQEVTIHSIFCGNNFKQIKNLKPAYVYTNSANIEQGTYYYTSAYGKFTYTFKILPDKDPKQIMARGTLTAGSTDKSKMVKELCIVGKIPSLPAAFNKNIRQVTLSVEDPKWQNIMRQYGMFGKPAFGKGVYQDQRSTDAYQQHGKKVYAANQAYLNATQEYFNADFKRISKGLVEEVNNAIKYAHQEDGFAKGKVYPSIQEPQVWTALSKNRYEEQIKRRNSQKAWDQIMQQNFDWLFALIGKDNKVLKSTVTAIAKPKWQNASLNQVARVTTKLANGKSLALDFLITSSKIDPSILQPLKVIEEQALLVRNSAIARNKTPRKIIKLPTSKNIKVFSPTKKIHLFFSLFREKTLGDTYHYH